MYRDFIYSRLLSSLYFSRDVTEYKKKAWFHVILTVRPRCTPTRGSSSIKIIEQQPKEPDGWSLISIDHVERVDNDESFPGHGSGQSIIGIAVTNWVNNGVTVVGWMCKSSERGVVLYAWAISELDAVRNYIAGNIVGSSCRRRFRCRLP